MKRVTIVIGALLGAALLFAVIAFVMLGYLFHMPPPKQHQFGFTGAWQHTSTFGVEERPLPPAKAVWADYQIWIPRTNAHTDRIFVTRIGNPTRQSGFQVRITSGDTPMGAQKYTEVDFVYEDPTNGTYFLNWSLRGEHDVRFLRFDGKERLYQLRPYGQLGEYPPKLAIVAIEGIEPWYP